MTVCTCPASVAMANRRDNLKTIWQSPEWKAANKIFHSLHPDNTCERCGRTGKIVPGHTSEDYRDMSSYIAKVRDNRCEALCGMCNWQESKGKKPCPLCVSRKSEVIHYIGQDQEECFYCLPDAVIEEREARKAGFKKFLRAMQDRDNAYRREVYQRVKSRGVDVG